MRPGAEERLVVLRTSLAAGERAGGHRSPPRRHVHRGQRRGGNRVPVRSGGRRSLGAGRPSRFLQGAGRSLVAASSPGGWTALADGDVTLRWVRALSLALVLLTSSVGGHAAAGGETSAGLLMVPLFLTVAAAVVPFLGAPLGPVRVTALLLVGQGLLHAMLELFDGPAGGVGSGSVGHHGHADAGRAIALSSSHLPMVSAHVAAALLVGWWLVSGERAVGVLVRLAGRPWAGAWRVVREAAELIAGTRVEGRACPAPVREAGQASPMAWIGRNARRRGPPLPSCLSR